MKKGQTNNPNGRPKGSLNKRTLVLLDVFTSQDYCPAIEAIKILKSGTLEPDEAITAHLKMMEFKFAKRKAIEHSVDVSNISDEELLSETKKLLGDLSGLSDN